MATAQKPDRPEDGPEPPEPSPRVSLLFEDGSANEDFAWIAARFREVTGATDMILSLHPAGGAPELLMMQGRVRFDAGLRSEALAFAAHASAPARRRSDGGPALRWEKLPGGGEPVPLLVLMLAADGYNQVVLTALFGNGRGEGQAETAALRIYPVLVGYFRLWLVARAQRLRLDAFASALDRYDAAVCLLDAQARLLFANKAALELLEAGEGLMRTGAGVTAADISHAVKLRVAIDHFIASGTGASNAGAAIVHLGRSNCRRPLIAAVLPAGLPRRSSDDPALLLFVFDPEQDISALLPPACQAYGLSPAETRLACLLLEGLTVSEAALRMRVKVPTLRTYLKQIFGKTGTSRQSDLVRLLMGSLVRARTGPNWQIV